MSVRRLAPPELQPKNFSFSKDNLAWAKKELTKYPEGRQQSAIIPLLWRAQEQSGGWLPEAAIRHVADFLGMAHIRALEVATYYTMFNLTPVGKFHVQLCGTTPCRLRGADDLEKIITAWEDSTYEGLEGPLFMRKCDHQVVQGGYMTEATRDPKYPHLIPKILAHYPAERVTPKCRTENFD